MSVPQPVPKWDIQTVANFIGGIGLESLAPAFKENAVNGADLISLTEEDYIESLGCTKLQVRVLQIALHLYQSTLERLRLYIPPY